jgi:hypothetical protein
MSKQSDAKVREKPKRGGTIAFILVFIVLFLLELLAAIPLMFFTISPSLYKTIYGPLSSNGFVANMFLGFENFFTSVFSFGPTWSGISDFQYGLSLALVSVFLLTLVLFFGILPFVNMAHNKRVHKIHRKGKNVLAWFSFSLVAIYTLWSVLIIVSNYWNVLAKVREFYLTTVLEHMPKIGNIFQGEFFFFVIPICVIVVALIMDIFTVRGEVEDIPYPVKAITEAPRQEAAEETIVAKAMEKAPLASKAAVADMQEKKEAPVQEKAVPVMGEEEKVTPIKAKDENPIIPEAVAPQEEDHEYEYPTNRDMEILNTLEPFHLHEVKLQGIYRTDIDKILLDLEPTGLKPAVLPDDELTKEGELAFKEKASEETKVTVMPGVDEWRTAPWPKGQEKVESSAEEEPKIIEESAVEEEPEEKPEEIFEEKKVEEPVEEPKAEEEKPEEAKTEEAVPEKVEAEEEKEPNEPVWKADNTLYPSTRSQEHLYPDNEPITGDAEEPITTVLNSPLGIDLLEKRRIVNFWRIPEYNPEEEKPVVEEVKPAEEVKPVEEVKPAEEG